MFRRAVVLLFVVTFAGACGNPSGDTKTSTGEISMSERPATPPAAIASPPDEPWEPEITSPVPAAETTTSSAMSPYDARGILRAVPPGWHSQAPPRYPEWVQLHFQDTQTINKVDILAQPMHQERAPRLFDVQTSTDGRAWVTAMSVENGCENEKGRWHSFQLEKAVTTRWLRLLIKENCGEPTQLTLRGLRVE